MITSRTRDRDRPHPGSADRRRQTRRSRHVGCPQYLLPNAIVIRTAIALPQGTQIIQIERHDEIALAAPNGGSVGVLRDLCCDSA
jgi:hypothetical protein